MPTQEQVHAAIQRLEALLKGSEMPAPTAAQIAAEMAVFKQYANYVEDELWVFVCNEKENFTLTQTETLRYGAGTQWSTEQTFAAGTYFANNALFGGDPAENVVKKVEKKGLSGRPTAPVKPALPEHWQALADEYDPFTLTQTEIVRYGTDTRWHIGELKAGSYICGNHLFGLDPARGSVKRIEKGVGTAPPPPPPPPPIDPNPNPDPIPNPNNPQLLTFTENPNNVPGVGRGLSDNVFMDGSKSFTQQATGSKLYRVIAKLTPFRLSDISQSYLTYYENFLGQVRNAGAMVNILHATWFNDFGLTGVQAWERKISDSPLNIVLRHIQQLAPIWERNADVIFYMYKGFNGCWGEDNKSSNGLGIEDGDAAIPGLRQVLYAIQDVLMPKGRMTALRYPPHHQKIFNTTSAFNPNNFFSSSREANCGFFNDFLFSDFSESIWSYIGSRTKAMPMGGEGVPSSYSEARARRVLLEFAACHWSNMQPAFQSQFQALGVYDELMRRLGYRYVLRSGKLPGSVASGQPLNFELTIENEGFANIFNPRPMDTILRNQSNGNIVRMSTRNEDGHTDSRRILPKEGSGAVAVKLQAQLPAVPAGVYDVLLHLKHDYASVASRPEYSLQFANQNTWESGTGFNKIGAINVT